MSASRRLCPRRRRDALREGNERVCATHQMNPQHFQPLSRLLSVGSMRGFTNPRPWWELGEQRGPHCESQRRTISHEQG